MKIYCLSLGCAKNRVDSECLAGDLERAGHTLVGNVDEADVGIVNTCGFIRPACEESIAAILDLEELKQKGRLNTIGVVGCLVNRYSNDLSKEIPSVDFWAKSEDWDSVIRSLGGTPGNTRYRTPLPLASRSTRYLKISEGCDNRCSYCTIPGIRGGLKSLSIGELVTEAAELVAEGAVELCLVGQDLTAYGKDTYGKSSLVGLLDELEASLPKNIWIRLLYLHPSGITRELLERVAAGTQILPYLDIPIQHADPEVLSSMNRRIAPEELSHIFSYARSINSDFALRTTCIVGFPGEKKRHFDNMLNFIAGTKFDRMGAFPFYPEAGTAAAGMAGRAGAVTVKKRMDKLMALQEEISYERQESFVGRVMDVLVEKIDRENSLAEGRSYREAPDIDGVIEIRGISEKIHEGAIVKVRIKEAMPHDMAGEELTV